MLSLEHPEYLYLVLAAPLLVVAFYLYLQWRKRAIARLGDPELVQELMPDNSVNRHALKFWMTLAALLILIIALVNPRLGTRPVMVETSAVELVVALDISSSMKATDVRPSRLERARRFLTKFADETTGDKVALVAFAGVADVQVPMTGDRRPLREELSVISPDQVATGYQGTDMLNALEVATGAFRSSEGNNRAILLISDGENHEQDAVDYAESLADDGVRLYTVGIGTTEGGLIPIVRNRRSDYKRDETGNPVRSSLNAELLRELADAGEGNYYNLTENSDEVVIAQLGADLQRLERGAAESQEFEVYISYFQYPLLLAIILLALEMMVRYRRGRLTSSKLY